MESRQLINPTFWEYLIPLFGAESYNSRCRKLDVCNKCPNKSANDSRLGIAHGFELALIVYGTGIGLYCLLR